MKQMERRKYKRIEANIKTSFVPEGGGERVDSLIINMSQGGMLLKSKFPFPVDLFLMVKIEKGPFTRSDIIIPAQIRRCETVYENKLYHIAVEINRNDRNICDKIDDFYFKVLEWKRKDSEKRLKN